MNSEVKTNYNFSVKNVNFFKNALSLLIVDDNKGNINFKKNNSSNIIERECLILFNLYHDGLMLRSLSKCKQIYCFLYMDSNCFSSFNIFEKDIEETIIYENNNVCKKRKINNHNINDDEKKNITDDEKKNITDDEKKNITDDEKKNITDDEKYIIDDENNMRNDKNNIRNDENNMRNDKNNIRNDKNNMRNDENNMINYNYTIKNCDNYFSINSYDKKKKKKFLKEETNSINSDNLYTGHAFDEENEVIKLKSLSPLKINDNEKYEKENEYNIRKKIYEEIDEKKNYFEFLVSPFELLRALEFLDAIILNIKFDYTEHKLIFKLTDEDGDTSETFVKIVVDYYSEIYKLEKYTFQSNNYNYFSLQSEILSFYLEYLIKSNDQYITFYINEYINDTTCILKMETKNKNYERAVQLMPKENFDEYKSLKNETFKYRIKDISKINQALKISSHVRLDFQENGLLRFQFTLKEYNMNGTHLCYFIQPLSDLT
ncbi:conserved Plasmodium protein, unknown function [Plasmodium reichenowi]|uniref:Uncharacterized protein n=1 Tax=Plasmodium reichenowi TaxID=5854 RepID=A0A060S0L4_PLARE|nr:hypothetical protein PRSY57_1460300 [Plasmodium reichenowi]KYN94261.1 hypothetical protein PRSY57_1460300 [Plasmodium reichenowi]CDO67074.1 conserved Plasmodium protein, unknown function [Plasmodium reichenowi]